MDELEEEAEFDEELEDEEDWQFSASLKIFYFLILFLPEHRKNILFFIVLDILHLHVLQVLRFALDANVLAAHFSDAPDTTEFTAHLADNKFLSHARAVGTSWHSITII